MRKIEKVILVNFLISDMKDPKNPQQASNW